MILGFAIGVSVLVVTVVLLPFVIGKGGRLASAQSLNSAPQLLQLKAEILKGYIADEDSYRGKLINKYVWESRRLYWVHRYVDVARRLDYVQGQQSPGGSSHV